MQGDWGVRTLGGVPGSPRGADVQASLCSAGPLCKIIIFFFFLGSYTRWHSTHSHAAGTAAVPDRRPQQPRCGRARQPAVPRFRGQPGAVSTSAPTSDPLAVEGSRLCAPRCIPPMKFRVFHMASSRNIIRRREASWRDTRTAPLRGRLTRGMREPPLPPE